MAQNTRKPSVRTPGVRMSVLSNMKNYDDTLHEAIKSISRRRGIINLKYYPTIRMGGLTKKAQHILQEGRSPGQDSNPGFLE